MPIKEAQHALPKIFVYNDLRNSTHAFLRHDAIREPLQPTYQSNPNKLPTQITTHFGPTVHFPNKFLQFLGRECVESVDHKLRNRA